MNQEQAIERARIVQKSSEVARKVSAARGDAAKVAMRLLVRASVAKPVEAPDMWSADNAAPTAQVQGRSVREALSECLGHVATDGLFGGLIPSALSSLILAAYDIECQCPVERLPQCKVSVERCRAHVESLGLSMPPAQAAQVARRTALVLWNHVSTRRPVMLPSEQGWASDDAVVPDRAPADGDELKGPATLAGRQVRGYAKVVAPLAWGDGKTVTPIGAVMELLVPDDRDREALQRAEARGVPSLAVWWDGRARIVRQEAMRATSRAEWADWVKENGSC